MPVLDNPKWETFAQARAEGCSQRVAYKKAFPNSEKWKDKTVDNRASELWGVREIRGRYEELKEQAAQGAVMTRKEKRELLAEMARDERLLPSEMQSAKPTKKGASKMNNPMTYIQNGDYQIPDLKLSQQPEKPLGKYGRMRKTYLKEHRPILYNQMLLSEKLYPHLIEIDETAQSRLEQMMLQLAKEAGATEELKASNPMKWVGLMNTCKAQAEEILMAELINS